MVEGSDIIGSGIPGMFNRTARLTGALSKPDSVHLAMLVQLLVPSERFADVFSYMSLSIINHAIVLKPTFHKIKINPDFLWNIWALADYRSSRYSEQPEHTMADACKWGHGGSSSINPSFCDRLGGKDCARSLCCSRGFLFSSWRLRTSDTLLTSFNNELFRGYRDRKDSMLYSW